MQKLISDNRFFTALKNTLVLPVISVTIEMVPGMALALIMDKAVCGIGVVRTTSLTPWTIPLLRSR